MPDLQGTTGAWVGGAPPSEPEDVSSPAAVDDAMSEPSWSPIRARAGRSGALAVRTRPASAADQPVLADGMLRLMLILLAFFVFLHSRSEPSAERATPILDSLALRFAASTATAGDDAMRDVARLFDPASHLRRRLVGHLPITAGEVGVPGTLLAFDLAEAALFVPERAEIVRDRLVLLHRLAQALAEHEAGRGSHLVITTAWPDADAALAAARLRTLEAIFAETPLPPHRLRIGAATLPDGIWRFSIRAGHGDAA